MKIFNLFNRKKELKKATWEDITLGMFYKIRDILACTDEFTIPNLIELIYKVDVTNLSITKTSQYDISFLEKELPTKNVKLKDTYILNGRKYSSNINLTEVTTAQFIDFTNYSKEKDARYEKLLSVFVVPKGHRYNDGYDLMEVQDDILQMPIADVQSLAFFMIEQFRAFAIIFQHYLMEEASKMPKDLQKITKDAAQTITNLVSFQL